MYLYEIQFDCPIKVFGQEWQNPDRVEINSKCCVDFSDFTPYFLAAEWSLGYESWSMLIDGKLDAGTFSYTFINFGFWRAENKKEKEKKSKCKCIECRHRSIFQLCLLLRKAGLCLGCNSTLPLSPPNRAFSHKIHSGTSSQVLHTLFARKKKSFISLKESLGFFRYFPL